MLYVFPGSYVCAVFYVSCMFNSKAMLTAAPGFNIIIRVICEVNI